MATKPPSTYITKLKTMVVAPGRKRAHALVSRFHNKTQAVNQAIALPVWIRPFAVSLGGTALVVLTGAGTWAVVNSVIRTITEFTVPAISLPPIPGLPNPLSKPVSDRGTRDINQILRRRQQLEIPEVFFTQFVDNLFYTKNPELQGRSLTSNPADTALRNEWYGIAENLLNQIEQANLSTAARQKLGRYSSRDEAIWRQQARSGELGNYTIDQLNKDTNEKFDRLFPGQQRGKLNQRTFGQIWYAIAADQVSKVKRR